MSKIITLNNGLEVEVDSKDDFREISSRSDSKIDSGVDAMTDLLTKVADPIKEAVQKISEKSTVEHVKVGVGIKVGAEGNFFVAKSSVDANIQIEMMIKGKNA